MLRLAAQTPIALVVALFLGAPAVSAEMDRRIDRIVAAAVDKDGPGAAVLVVKDGRTIYSRGHGLADLPGRRPITPRTRFDLASVSKQFTAAAVLLLVDAGKFTVDTPVKELLPDYRVPVRGRPVLVRDLLSHMSGLEDYLDQDWAGDEELARNLTPEGHLRLLNDTRPQRPPGRRYEYNNTNYVLLALIVERTSGMPFARFVSRRILEPLGMTQTVVYDDFSIVVPEVATGYRPTKGGGWERSFDPSIITGDGNMFSSLEDLAKWDRALRGGHLLPAAAWRRAFTRARLDSGKRVSYGFGWEVDDDAEHPWVGHSGSWMGTATYISRYLEDDLTVVVLSNNEDLDALDLSEQIALLFE